MSPPTTRGSGFFPQLSRRRNLERHRQSEEPSHTSYADPNGVDHIAAPGSVSRKRTATTMPDRPVIAATNHIAPARPNASAVRPANNAPSAYPRSRHRRYTPTDEARQIGAATSPIAASRV